MELHFKFWYNLFKEVMINLFIVIKIDFRASGLTQVIEHLPSKYEALSSNPSTTKNDWLKFTSIY
jgi:hypothetical protein